MQTDTLIVGGGLAGLALAEGLARAGVGFRLVEARDRFGGRILTKEHGAGSFDMGPAWFWPGQPRMDALVQRLGLRRFEQFSDGAALQEDERGALRQGYGIASMRGSWRLEGGLGALIHALEARLSAGLTQLNAVVTHLSKNQSGITATLANGTNISARRVVLAIPPRLAARIRMDPPLPASATQAMNVISTWMAGQAKAVAVYDSPFWREAGLSGDAMSRAGPMVEIHDASPTGTGPCALFGFVGVPASHRQNETQLRDAVLAQLRRLFGPDAGAPLQLFLKDWAYDPFTATQADQEPLFAHPRYGLPSELTGLWDGQLMFAGSEVADQFGGYLEGALEASDRVLHSLT